ncbi:MAG: hypothetical protein ABI947_29790 [Chloroflexota bacterium]
MNDILRIAWDRWQIIGKINGDYLARLFVNGFYFTVMVPFALGVKLFTDPLALRRVADVHWIDRNPVSATLDDARGQS